MRNSFSGCRWMAVVAAVTVSAGLAGSIGMSVAWAHSTPPQSAAGAMRLVIGYPPGGTPPAMLVKIQQAASVVLKKPDIIAKIAAGGMDATPSARALTERRPADR